MIWSTFRLSCRVKYKVLEVYEFKHTNSFIYDDSAVSSKSPKKVKEEFSFIFLLQCNVSKKKKKNQEVVIHRVSGKYSVQGQGSSLNSTINTYIVSPVEESLLTTFVSLPCKWFGFIWCFKQISLQFWILKNHIARLTLPMSLGQICWTLFVWFGFKNLKLCKERIWGHSRFCHPHLKC